MRINRNQQNIARLNSTQNIAKSKKLDQAAEGEQKAKAVPEQTVRATSQEKASKLGEFSTTGQLRLSRIQEQLRQASRAQEVAGKLEQMGPGGKAEELGFGGKEGLAEGMGGKTFGGKLGLGGLTITAPERGTGLEGSWNPKDGMAGINPFKSAADLVTAFRAGDPRLMEDANAAGASNQGKATGDTGNVEDQFENGGTQTSKQTSSDKTDSKGNQVVTTETVTTDHKTGAVMTDVMTQSGDKFTQEVTVRDKNGKIIAHEKTTNTTPNPDGMDYRNMPEVDPETVERQWQQKRGGVMDPGDDPSRTQKSVYDFIYERQNFVQQPGSDSRNINWGPDGGGQQTSGIPAPETHQHEFDNQVDSLRGGDPLEPKIDTSRPGPTPDGESGDIPSDPNR
ncbi:MAG: hypothetical protein JXQ27_09655 [Acidobacteria bacterium]|nr:hypothetical protein [Acidobacteriota bacterium]